jgi:hypothetical protein
LLLVLTLQLALTFMRVALLPPLVGFHRPECSFPDHENCVRLRFVSSRDKRSSWIDFDSSPRPSFGEARENYFAGATRNFAGFNFMWFSGETSAFIRFRRDQPA